MPYLKWLENIDRILFLIINHDADHVFLDDIMTLLRNPLTWIPLYVYIGYIAIKNGRSRWWLFILFSVLSFAITDSVSARLLKPLFERPRPCQDPVLHNVVRDLAGCGGLYSMPSSHAANHFGLAAFWFLAIFAMTGKKWYWLWIWASAISYAQIYVGKHYPSDIIAGAIFGCCIGLLSGKIFEHVWHSTARRSMYYLPDLHN